MSRQSRFPFRAGVAALGLLVAAGSALGQGAVADPHAGHTGHAPAAASAGDLATGEVRRIDREARKITLRHGEIANLGMPPMTMVFQLADPGLMDRAKVGDRVQFRAEKVEGAYRVTEIRPAP